MNHSWWMFMFHEWVAKSVYTRQEPALNPYTGEIRPDCVFSKTDILYVCACGKVKTTTVRGAWKLEEVRA